MTEIIESPRFATVTAHRGLHTEAIENTIGSANAAIGAGAAAIEMDARPTRDGQLVIHHNAMDGLRRIGWTARTNLPLLEGTTPIPTFGAMLDAVRGRALVNVHIKHGADPAQVVDELAEHDALRGAMAMSFFPGQIRGAKDRAPDLRTALIVAEPGPLQWLRERVAPDLEFRRAVRAGAEVIAPDHTMVTPDFLDRAERFGLRVAPWAVDDPDELERLIADPRVETVITNRSDIATGMRDTLARARRARH